MILLLRVGCVWGCVGGGGYVGVFLIKYSMKNYITNIAF